MVIVTSTKSLRRHINVEIFIFGHWLVDTLDNYQKEMELSDIGAKVSTAGNNVKRYPD